MSSMQTDCNLIIRRNFVLFLGIILAFTKRNPIQIAESIKNFHSEFISIELVQHLLQYIPNDIEVINIK
jgi:hypothetical protein